MHIAARLRAAGGLGVIYFRATKVGVVIDLDLIFDDVAAIRVAQVKLQRRRSIRGAAAVVVIVYVRRVGVVVSSSIRLDGYSGSGPVVRIAEGP